MHRKGRRKNWTEKRKKKVTITLIMQASAEFRQPERELYHHYYYYYCYYIFSVFQIRVFFSSFVCVVNWCTMHMQWRERPKRIHHNKIKRTHVSWPWLNFLWAHTNAIICWCSDIILYHTHSVLTRMGFC